MNAQISVQPVKQTAVQYMLARTFQHIATPWQNGLPSVLRSKPAATLKPVYSMSLAVVGMGSNINRFQPLFPRKFLSSFILFLAQI